MGKRFVYSPTPAQVRKVEGIIHTLYTLGWLVDACGIATLHGVTLEEVCSTFRAKHVVMARYELWTRMVDECGSVQQVATTFGRNDDSCVRRGVWQWKRGRGKFLYRRRAA